MAGDNGCDVLQDLFDDLSTDSFSSNIEHTYTHPESQLCIPQDCLDDIEFFPSFMNDSISLVGLDNLFPPYEPHDMYPLLATSINEERPSLKECNNNMGWPPVDKLNKTQRKKREEKRGSWSRNDFKFPLLENEEPSFGLKENQGWRPRCSPESSSSENREWKLRCSHCETTETPQWRQGTLGPKSLCNACGVRYKSGRSLPEYRPAASPTFDIHKHSNFHKEILKKIDVDDREGNMNMN